MKSNHVITRLALIIAAASLIFSVVTLIRTLTVGGNVFLSVILVIGTAVVTVICAIMSYLLRGYDPEGEEDDPDDAPAYPARSRGALQQKPVTEPESGDSEPEPLGVVRYEFDPYADGSRRISRVTDAAPEEPSGAPVEAAPVSEYAAPVSDYDFSAADDAEPVSGYAVPAADEPLPAAEDAPSDAYGAQEASTAPDDDLDIEAEVDRILAELESRRSRTDSGSESYGC